MLVTDRRLRHRGPLFAGRRRHGRVEVAQEVFYESPDTFLVASQVEVSLRGLFLPCARPEAVGAQATVRLDTGDGPLLVMQTEVLRSQTGPRGGMALRIGAMSDADRQRLGAFLLRRAGVRALPQLGRRFPLLAALPSTR